EDKLKDAVDSAKDKVEGVVGDTGEIGENLKDKAQSKIEEVASEVEGKVSGTVDNLKDKLPG
ncbi:MAG: YtxH domain-containing protein, partial [Cyanobacteria bacterium J06560_2]